MLPQEEGIVMIRKVVSVVFVVALMSAAPSWSVAQTATPTEGTPQAGPGPTAELCEKAEIEKGDTTGIVVEPPGDVRGGEAGVVPLPTTDANDYLWVVEITMMPQSCWSFHAQEGPVVLFVHSGSIEYAVHSGTVPPATVTMGHQDVKTTFTTVPLDTLVPLHSGDWVTLDRAAWFTYRNLGPGSAVVSMAAYVTLPGAGGSGGKG
jgi:hypothetical protein